LKDYIGDKYIKKIKKYSCSNISFSSKEKEVLSFPLFNLDLQFVDSKKSIYFNNLSA